MFSSRLDWNVAANPITRLLLDKRNSGAEILDLTESNPTAAGFEYPAGILSALADPRALRYEPVAAGMQVAREAIAGYYGGGKIDLSRIIVTASTSEAYGFIFKLLANPGDEVLVPRPSYPLFEFLSALESVRVVNYSLHYHGSWTLDFDSLASRITPRTRAIVLVNPNNPTGSFLKKSELARLVEMCRGRDIALLSDEVFSDYGFEADRERLSSLIGLEEILTFSLSGLSKTAGLPQLKLGWIVTSGPEELRRDAFARLELIADTYLSVGTPVQWAAPSLLASRGYIQSQIMQRVRGNLAFLHSEIGPASPWRVLAVEGGWYATIQAPRIRSEEDWVLSLLAEDQVLVQPGFFFDFEAEAFLVVSLLTSPTIFHEGIRRILSRA
jgi:aspartate/methionine/tyrosine aminotransferase